MQPKPERYSSEDAQLFKDPQVVAAYVSRPPYAQMAIELLADLATDRPATALDVGCGPGDIARRLAPLVDRLDAVDFSPGMIETGRRLPGGNAPNLRWIVAAVEEAPLDPPYALVTAGESLHWMDWEIVMPRFAECLSPRGLLAIMGRTFEGPTLVRERVQPVLKRYAAVRVWQNVDLLEELASRKLFTQLGSRRFGPDPWQPTIEEYLACRHSQRSFAHSAMGAQAAAAFDAAIRQVLEDLCSEGTLQVVCDRLQLSIETSIVWGRPAARAALDHDD